MGCSPVLGRSDAQGEMTCSSGRFGTAITMGRGRDHREVEGREGVWAREALGSPKWGLRSNCRLHDMGVCTTEKGEEAVERDDMWGQAAAAPGRRRSAGSVRRGCSLWWGLLGRAGAHGPRGAKHGAG
jgi:hypothetical protein